MRTSTVTIWECSTNGLPREEGLFLERTIQRSRATSTECGAITRRRINCRIGKRGNSKAIFTFHWTKNSKCESTMPLKTPRGAGSSLLGGEILTMTYRQTPPAARFNYTLLGFAAISEIPHLFSKRHVFLSHIHSVLMPTTWELTPSSALSH